MTLVVVPAQNTRDISLLEHHGFAMLTTITSGDREDEGKIFEALSKIRPVTDSEKIATRSQEEKHDATSPLGQRPEGLAEAIEASSKESERAIG
jgi:hypothetical protein